MTLPYPPPWQDLRTLSEHICASESAIENWVRRGIFPPPKKIGGKNLWEWKTVQRHLAHAGDNGPSLANDAARMREAMRNEKEQTH
jgi:hypothetical protein